MLPSFPIKQKLAITPTEFRPLDSVSRALGGPRIWLKSDDHTGSVVSGNKVRKLEFLLADAKSLACDTVLTCGGLQSNHCRATAALCARLGLNSHLLLRGPRSLAERSTPYRLDELDAELIGGNLLLDSLCGAEVSVYSPRYYERNIDAEFRSLAQYYEQQGCKPYDIPTGGSNGLGLWGYIEAAKELNDDFERAGILPSAVVCASGSGGTQGGLSLGFHLLEQPVQVVGMAVCDSESYFDRKIREDIDQWQMRYLPGKTALSADVSVTTVADYIGPGYGLGYPELFDCIRWVAETEGVVLDPVYTGKAFWGLVSEIKRGRFDSQTDIVFVHTGGIYGVFPYAAELLDAASPS